MSLCLVAIDIDNDGLQDSLGATVDGGDGTRGRRGVAHALGFLVSEKQLSQLYPIPDLDFMVGFMPT